MPTAQLLHPHIPRPANWLGLAGVLPFAAGALAAWRPDPVGTFAATALLAYGAVILSFLGGIHWGLALDQAQPRPAQLALGVLPSLAGWVAVLAGGRAGILLLMAGFVGVLAQDLRLTRNGVAPPWFASLRTVLTTAVLLCLTVGLAA
jgi:hypothetical protein